MATRRATASFFFAPASTSLMPTLRILYSTFALASDAAGVAVSECNESWVSVLVSCETSVSL